ncbi:MAG: hypothetical protein AAB774_00370 [Patescibacteria group bacterium]
MKIINSEINDWQLIYDVSVDHLEEDDGLVGDEEFLEHLTVRSFEEVLSEMIVDERLWSLFLDAWQRRHKLPRSIRVLMAHGAHDKNGDWWFFEQERPLRKVKDWVREHDGKYTMLATCCCNNLMSYVRIKRSLLLISNANVFGSRVDTLDRYSVVTPKGIQDRMTLEYETSKLMSL